MERQKLIVPTTVADVKNLSSTVKGIKLSIKESYRPAAAFQVCLCAFSASVWYHRSDLLNLWSK